MNERHQILERLARGQWVLTDGSVATELAHRGYNPKAPLFDAAAAREAPATLLAAHRAYADAGAHILTAHTARTTVRALARGGLGMRAAALTHRAVDLALEAAQLAGRPVAVAGTLGPLEGPSSPEATPPPRVLAHEHAEQARRLASTGCDLVLVEAMPTVREALAATAAARYEMDVVWATLAVHGGRCTDGAALDEAAAQLVAVGAQAILVEGTVASDLIAAVAALADVALDVPIGVRMATELAVPPDQFAADVLLAQQRGARILGGSQGALAEHIRVLASQVQPRAAA